MVIGCHGWAIAINYMGTSLDWHSDHLARDAPRAHIAEGHPLADPMSILELTYIPWSSCELKTFPYIPAILLGTS